MHREIIPLWPTPRDGEFQPYMTPFLLDGEEARPAVIVCPGGAYCFRAEHEADPVSERFNRLGFHAFTLQYRVAPANHYPAPQLDALRAIKLVRANAEKWHVDPAKILILGFSAGGHLASSTTYLYEELNSQCAAGDAADAASPRPDGAILCYAVISGVDYMHYGSFQWLFGKECMNVEELLPFSGERRVHKDMPPVFLWHTAEDACVPVENSLHFAEAMRRMKLPVGLAVYPFGPHGIGLADDYPDAKNWPEQAAGFFRHVWSRQKAKA